MNMEKECKRQRGKKNKRCDIIREQSNVKTRRFE
jgi:hypothetical protein